MELPFFKVGKTAGGGDLGAKVRNWIYIELPVRTLKWSGSERPRLKIEILKSAVYKCI